MYKKQRARARRRVGVVLASVLLLGFAAVGAASLAFAVAAGFWDRNEVLMMSTSRENVAEEAMSLSLFWFEQELRAGTVSGIKRLFVHQKIDVPDAVLSDLRSVRAGIEISAFVLDPEYDDLFDAEAKMFDLAHAAVLQIAVVQTAESADISYMTRGFELRVHIRERIAPHRERTLRRGMIALYDENGNFWRCIDSYTKK